MPQDVEEIKYEPEKETKFQSLLRGISEKYFFGILIIILIAIYLVSQKILTTEQLIMYIGFVIVAVLFMSYRGMRGDSYLDYKEALALTENFMKEMQRLRKIPFGQIKVTLQGRLRKFGGQPSEYSIHAKITTNEYRVVDYEVIVDPLKSGLGVIGIVEMRRGYDALRKPELVYQATPDMWYERQRRNYQESGDFEYNRRE
jgi:hypothetical protein